MNGNKVWKLISDFYNYCNNYFETGYVIILTELLFTLIYFDIKEDQKENRWNEYFEVRIQCLENKVDRL